MIIEFTYFVWLYANQPFLPSFFCLKDSLEDISYLLRIPQRKPYGTMEGNVKKALKVPVVPFVHNLKKLRNSYHWSSLVLEFIFCFILLILCCFPMSILGSYKYMRIVFPIFF